MSIRRTLEIDPEASGELRVADAAQQPTASVILPMYNAGPFVEEAFARLNLLSGVDFEVIVVDDGSKDDTWNRLVEAQLNAPTTLIRLTRNAGVATARNIALRAASGTFVWMVDGDDHWPDDALAQLVSAANMHRSGMIVAQADKVIVASGEREAVTTPARNGTYNFEQMVHALLEGGLRGHLWNKLFRRELLGEDPFPVMRSKSDYCMIIRALPRIGTMSVISENVYEYRYQLGSITNSKISTPLDLLRCYEEASRISTKLGEVAAFNVSMEKFRFFAIAQIAYSEIWRYGENAVNGQAVREYLRGMLTFRGVLRLLGNVPMKQWALAAGLQTMPGVVRRAYLKRRSHRWNREASGSVTPRGTST